MFAARLDPLDRFFPALAEMRRHMDDVWTAYDHAPFSLAEGQAWPRTHLWDDGAALVLRAEVPGLSEKDINLSLNQDVLTLSGERRVVAPEGYQAHRKDRPAFRFSRSFALPTKVDAERVTATVKNGVLTVTLNKVPESQPRQITVRAS